MAKRFKKGSIEAKRFMAKIRLKKGKPKTTKKTLGAKSNKKDKVYIEFLNKKKNFKKDIKNFNSYAEALNYGKNNFDNFSPDMIKYKNYNLNALAPINKSEQTLSFVPKVITENQILKEINKVKEEILHLLNMQKEHILKGHKRSLGALVKNKQKEIGNLLKKCK